MINIKISDFSNESASRAKGIMLKEKLIPLLENNEEFSVDFEGIYRFASPFFNNSFASLAIIYGFDRIKQIQLLNISDIGTLAYNTSLDNAELICENPEFAEKINDIINSNVPKKED